MFRLPTEKEWDYACHAGAASDCYRFADGTEITESTLDKVAWYKNNSDNTTHPAGQKMPNAFGLYDMHGNVWEWCEDQHDNAGSSDRVCRGGSLDNDARNCLAGNWYCFSPDFRWGTLGFRLVADQK